MTPSPIPFGQVVIPAGRIVYPPELYGFENQVIKVTMHDAPSRRLTPDNQPLAGPAGCQWANVSVLLIDEPKSYSQAKVSPQWSDWKKAIDDKLKSLKEKYDWNDIL